MHYYVSMYLYVGFFSHLGIGKLEKVVWKMESVRIPVLDLLQIQ